MKQTLLILSAVFFTYLLNAQPGKQQTAIYTSDVIHHPIVGQKWSLRNMH